MPRHGAALLSSLLRSCATGRALRACTQIHAHALTSGLLPHVTLQTDLVLAYSKSSSIAHARKVFDEMPHRNMHSWNILLSSYVQASMHVDAINLFFMFMASGARPDHFTIPSVYRACGEIGDRLLGVGLHCWVVKLGMEGYVVVGGSLLDMYVKCGDMASARQLFEGMPERDAVSWNSMISGLVRDGSSSLALVLLRRMLDEGLEVSDGVICSALVACGKAEDLRKGLELHSKSIRTLPFCSDIALSNALIDMYSRCGSVCYARRVFNMMTDRNVVTWTTIITCYGAHGMGEESLYLYESMVAQGLKPNPITFTSLLTSCNHSGLVDQGLSIFNSMASTYGVEPQPEHYACVVDLLGRSGDVEGAMKVVNGMPMEPTASVWGALLGACVTHKNVKIGEIAAGRLFELEIGNASNYVALCDIYDSLGMRSETSKIRCKMRGLGLIKTVGCSWIDMNGEVHTFSKGDSNHLLTAEIFSMLGLLIRQCSILMMKNCC